MGINVSTDIDVRINDDVLKFLGTGSNVMLSDISNSDRVMMMCLLKQYYLSLRKRIGISEDITFGLEIEFENALKDIIDDELYLNFNGTDWVMVPDGSLVNGAEINSPKLTDTYDNWIDLNYVCRIVDKNAYVGDNTGGHIHIGTQILGNNPKYWANFAKLWATYENVINRFLYGEYVGPRANLEKHAASVARDFIRDINSGRIDDRAKMINARSMFKLFDCGDKDVKIRRKKSVNFTNVSDLESYKYNMNIDMNTVEFRSPNGTFDPVIWQNNVNLITKLMLYCKSDKFDEDRIIRRMNQIISDDIPSNIFKYSRIYMEQAIELSDMIFDNNLDKVYFLRQYVKSGEVSNKPMVKSKKFTR